jgi:hypothetical protein
VVKLVAWGLLARSTARVAKAAEKRWRARSRLEEARRARAAPRSAERRVARRKEELKRWEARPVQKPTSRVAAGEGGGVVEAEVVAQVGEAGDDGVLGGPADGVELVEAAVDVVARADGAVGEPEDDEGGEGEEAWRAGGAAGEGGEVVGVEGEAGGAEEGEEGGGAGVDGEREVPELEDEGGEGGAEPEAEEEVVGIEGGAAGGAAEEESEAEEGEREEGPGADDEGHGGEEVGQFWGPCARARSAEEVVLHDAPEGAEAVFPADLFAFLVGAAFVGDADFVQAAAAGGDLGGDLGLEAEAVFLDGDGADEVAAEDLVAGFHVGEVEVGEDVGAEGEEAVAEGVPEVEDAVAFAAGEAGAEDDVGDAGGDGFDEAGVLGGVVLEVGVLDDDELALGGGDAGAEGGALALVDGVSEEGDAGGAGVGLKDFVGAVGGVVVDDDEFLVDGDSADAIDE